MRGRDKLLAMPGVRVPGNYEKRMGQKIEVAQDKFGQTLFLQI